MTCGAHSENADNANGAAATLDTDRPYRYVGRRRGRRLRPAQRIRLEQMLPRLRIAGGAEDARRFDPRVDAFEERRPVWLEIGFGRGEHLAAQAREHPDVGFIGIEPYLNGVAAALALVEQATLSNVRLVVDDARNFLPRLATGSIRRVFILFPDPWPKKKHQRRRLFSPETVDELARVLEAGGELLVATDHQDYAEWIRRVVCGHPEMRMRDETGFANDHPSRDLFKTRYQKKAERSGTPIIHFRFQRDPTNPAGRRLAGDD